MIKPQTNPSRYYRLLHQKRETELFLSALHLHIFTDLEAWNTVEALAVKTGLNQRNLSLYLNALACVGFLDKDGERYRNTSESNEYLNENSPLYLGEYLLFREQMMSLSHLEDRVKNGPDVRIARKNNGVEVYDFYESARVSIAEMYSGRVQSLTAAVKRLFADRTPKKILDLGGGNGILAIETVLAFPGCCGVVFEHPSVVRLPEGLIRERGLSDRISVLEGDFNMDDIGTGYDLIIASGILDFAKEHLDRLLEKLRQALTPSGYLYIVSREVSEDYQTPPDGILGWLSSHLDGLDLLLTKGTIDQALLAHGFHSVEESFVGGIFTGLPGRFYHTDQSKGYCISLHALQ